LKEIVLDPNSNWETVPEFYGDRAVLESNIAITLEWPRDLQADAGDEDANGCYTGLTRDIFAARVLYCGQPVLQETLLMVKTGSKRPRNGWFYVPVAYRPKQSWRTTAVAFSLARIVNGFHFRGGDFVSYMARTGVQVAEL
jgi:hypothetical protein